MLKNIFLIIILTIGQHCSALYSEQEIIQSIFDDDFETFLSENLNNETSCIEYFLTFSRNLRNGSQWAKESELKLLKIVKAYTNLHPWNYFILVLDTWGKRPSGFLSVFRPDAAYGHLDACLLSQFEGNNSERIAAQHCIAHVGSEGRGFDWGVCLPESCTRREMELILTNLAPRFGFKFDTIRTLSNTRQINAWGDWQFWVIAVFQLHLLLVILSTGFDLVTTNSSSKLLTSFSLYRNGKMLFTQRESSNLTCFDGLKMLALLQVVAEHSFVVWYTSGKYNFSNSNSGLLGTFSNYLIRGDHVAVAVFLFITGVLLSCQFMEARKKKYEN